MLVIITLRPNKCSLGTVLTANYEIVYNTSFAIPSVHRWAFSVMKLLKNRQEANVNDTVLHNLRNIICIFVSDIKHDFIYIEIKRNSGNEKRN